MTDDVAAAAAATLPPYLARIHHEYLLYVYNV
jgi:hypothetical protein